jgi:hypothetical protein
MEGNTKTGLGQRLKEEFRAFWLITFYLWIFLGSFTIYRRIVIEDTSAMYLHYGVALIEALVIAKVILIGNIFGFTRRFDNRPLIVPVAYKSIVFALLVLLFAVVEHIVEGWFHKQSIQVSLAKITDLGARELGARVLLLVVAFVPIFACGEIGRALGGDRLLHLFFSGSTGLPDARALRDP